MSRWTSESESAITAFSDELRSLRQRAGLSQSALAERAGLSTEAVSLLERGKRTPRPSTVQLLAVALGLTGSLSDNLFAAVSARPLSAAGLPRYGDLLVGRENETASIARLLTATPTPLVTVTGPGGVGKTRVAVAAAAAAQPRLAAGVRWVHVMSCDDAGQLVVAVAEALGVQSTGADLITVATEFDDRDLLLVLDGAELLLGAVAELCLALGSRARRLRLLVTSRERLHLPGEALLVLAPLVCAPRGDAEVAGPRTASPAAQLFRERAATGTAATGPDAAALLDDDDAAVESICAQVDGIPLAIELAAARTALVTVTQLATTLKKSLRYLYAPHADDEVALRDVMIADSFSLLTSSEQQLLTRLSVFPSSFTARAAASVCGEQAGGPTQTALLSSLVSKSLVLRGDDAEGEATFRLLRVIAEFGEDKLRDDPGAPEVRRRFASYYRELGALCAPRVRRGATEACRSVLDADVGSLRAAFDWCLQFDPPAALEMVGSLWPWWHLRGHYQEGQAAAETALHTAGRHAPAPLRAAAHTATGLLALRQGDYDRAQNQLQLGLDLYSSLSDHAGLCWSLALLGEVATQRAEYTVATLLHEQALVLARRTDDQYAVGDQLNALAETCWLRGDFARAEEHGRRALQVLSSLADEQGVIRALINLGVCARYRNDIDGAQVMMGNALERSKAIDFREGVAWSLNQLGVLSRLRGDHVTAAAQQGASLREHRAIGLRWRTASVLDERAAVLLAFDDPARATACLGAAEQLRREIGAPLPHAERAEREQSVQSARARVGSAFPALSLAGLADDRR